MQPGSTTTALIGRSLSSAPRLTMASRMRLACSSVMIGMKGFLRVGPVYQAVGKLSAVIPGRAEGAIPESITPVFRHYFDRGYGFRHSLRSAVMTALLF